MKRPILFATVLALSCQGSQIKQIKPPPPSEKRQPPACETAMGKRHLLEKVLGKWHEKALSGIRRIYFLEKAVNVEQARFDPKKREITISATPTHSIDRNIDALDHELGHYVYWRIMLMQNQVRVPFILRFLKLRSKYKNDKALENSGEYRKYVLEFSQAKITSSLTIRDWNEFLEYLKGYPESQCVKSYIQSFYLDKHRFISENRQIMRMVVIAKRLRLKSAQLSQEDARTLHLFLEEHKRIHSQFTSESKKLASILKKALGSTGDLCDSQANRHFSQILAKASQSLQRLLGYKTKMIGILKRNAKLLDKGGNESLDRTESPENERSGERSDEADDLLENELFARAVDSLMDLYFGPPQNHRFRLDEHILAALEKITIEDAPIFADAVSGYRMGLEMLETGISIEQIRKKALSSVPPRPYPGLFCKSKTTHPFSEKTEK